MGKKLLLFLCSVSFLGASLTHADESILQLKDSPSRARVFANCIACHSVDYILMNAGFLDQKGWEAVVNKMIKVMGAPIPPEDVPEILKYLSENYGPLGK